MSDWTLLPDVEPAAAVRFADLDAVFALEGEIVTLDSMTRTLRVEIGGKRYYVKRYAGLGKKALRRLFSPPRVQLEWENLQHFANWDIPTARLVGYGMEKKNGHFLRGALITAEIPDTVDLSQLAKQQDPNLKSRRWLDAVTPQLAAIARGMHERRFTHGDLKWRNLLVDKDDKLFLIDCPSGGFWWPPFLEYRIVKDLACLDKLAKRHLSRTRRLRFYLDYARKASLDAADKRRLKKIVGFFDGRDEDYENAATLRAAGRMPKPRCQILLGNDQVLTVERWLRKLPGKRLTCSAWWRGQKVLAKLFIAARGSERHWQRECAGAAALAAHGLPTPALLAQGELAGGGQYVLYEFLDGTRTPAATLDDLTPVFAQLGQLHAQGLVQDDAHLGNFLLQDGRLFLIDGDAIRPARDAADCAANLALLCAQLQPTTDAALRPALLAAYRTAYPAAAIDTAALDRAVGDARSARLTDYLDKCLRDCSLFKVAKRADRFFAVVRDEARLLAPLLHDPDAWLENGEPLKRGRSATLARVEIGGRQLVIKRYNIKSAGHALSRCWRPSRAWHSWVEGHRLDFLGIATPRPLALIERRYGPLRGKAWLITEYCPGVDLAAHFATLPESAETWEVDAVDTLYRQLAAFRITQGDAKATNLLWHDGRIHLIDLDGAQQHAGAAGFARAWRRDRERLLRNWPADSALVRALDRRLPPA